MKLLTETEVAERLEVTKACLRRWRHEARGVRFLHIGRLVRYRQQDLEQFILDNMQEVTSDEKLKAEMVS